MNQQQQEILNTFFVEVFNNILTWEETALSKSEHQALTVRELHIIEAVSKLEQTEDNTMSQIAKQLSISVGALTTAINVLVKKGYLMRSGKADDRRVVLIALTTKGQAAEEHHRKFHEKMITSVDNYLTDSEMSSLVNSLKSLSIFFKKQINYMQKEV